ncbi:NACHT domain-containing protein [Streptomyces sp. VNUA116]|uniref:NACHT domain-containing protein n=1 Tax=Streptomyces sp. VNUA116 TaxID=3062449 RepID=UPI00267560EF|nr:NACHT domain-containing protein [Streptomyces sp. VNUA116]WKU44258.1 NACHT domain-containing protein [Streptomyces sp. VNUA116]
MAGEAVLARVAGAVAGALAKSALARSPGAGLAAKAAAPVGWGRRRPGVLGEEETSRLVRRLSELRKGPWERLPENEWRAAADAVCEVFAAVGALDQRALFAADLDPGRLRTELLARCPGIVGRAGLGEAGEAAFQELLGAVCLHLVEYATSLPTFAARADVELVRRSGESQRRLGELLDRMDAVPGGAEFDERYREYIAATYGRVELFGLTLGCAEREWALSTAYISLKVTGGEEARRAADASPHLAQASISTVSTEQALASCERMLLRGPAGSGKSTLVQWLATNAARRTFDPDHFEWNCCVPFVLRLRTLTQRGALPMPGEFLSATGNPLAGLAPAGWVEGLLTSGWALVLIDGVDEVPADQRRRTREWLQSLLTAFPKARYVVTTRPSAVPEDWLDGQGFTSYSLQPMDREDIRKFITHWHRAAGAEGTYEESLQQAVATRRELGRLATNPLMCALLCALNRDRRMHLPRARKELYDAALDMLLVRRDNERDITAVEGVDLTRDEQTLLLQRLAYWLIRNGQTVTACADATEMIEEWLAAMPQVRAQGDARQVFTHLLIRSGLLREPVPGAMDFVHRTFQDYLGAKAAVEARDFGLLVSKAHDDQWEDVVRMAVGHARAEERARLLRQLMRRADRVKSHRHRLTLLMAACLEHAPELDPEVRAGIESRTKALLPPRDDEDAEALAKAGELVIELLQGPEELDVESARATIRTARLIGGDGALAVLSRFRKDDRSPVQEELSRCWSAFDTQEFVDAVLAEARVGRIYVRVESAEQIRALPRLPRVRHVTVEGNHRLTTEITRHEHLRSLELVGNHELIDLTPLIGCRQLKHLDLVECPAVKSLSPLTTTKVELLSLGRLMDGLSLGPLAGHTTLRRLYLACRPVRRTAEIPVGPQLTGLTLFGDARSITLDDLGQWPGLSRLGITGGAQAAALAQQKTPPSLTDLHLHLHPALDPRTLVHHQGVRELMLLGCTLSGSLAPLAEMRALTNLTLNACYAAETVAVDLTPLAPLERLTITVRNGTPVRGADLFPPERLVIE